MTTKTTSPAPRVSLTPPIRIALWLLIALSVCTILFFIPNSATPFDALRVTVVELLALAALVLWLIAHLASTEARIPRSITLFGFVVIIVLALLSALFTGSPLFALLGWGVESTTVLTLAFGILILFLIQSLLQTRARIAVFLMSLAGAACVALVYTFIRVVGAPLLGRFTWFITLPPSIIGTWNELALFAGLTALGVALVLDLFPSAPSRVVRVLTIGTYILSLLTLAFINHSISWALVGAVAFLLILFVFIQRRSVHHIPLYTIALLICASVFFFGGRQGSFIGDGIARANAYIGVPSSFTLDVRPSLSDTGAVTLSTLKKYPVLGVGPNFFNYAWMRSRPASFNQSIGWGTDFPLGWSYLATLPVLLGGFGILALLLLIGGFFIDTFVVLVRGNRTEGAALSVTASALAFYAWLVLALYTPGTLWVFLFFILTGVMIAIGRESGAIGVLSYRFGSTPRMVLLGSGAVALSIVLTAGLGYLIANKAWARSSFFDGVRAANIQGDLGGAESAVGRALTGDPQDIYARALSTVESLKLGRIAQDTSLSKDQLQAQFLQTMKLSLDTASSSVRMVPRNYQNLLTLGSVYETAALYGVTGGKEQALLTYTEVAKLAPTLPLIPYLKARVEAAAGNTGGARQNLEAALALKADYPDAILLLSQIEAANGNVTNAATIAERAFVSAPNDLGVLFQLGYLKYKSGRYDEARLVLERARALSPSYSNAKYFLGLSYDALGQHDAALQEFSDIARLNPGNQEVNQIISNIKNGFPALSGIGGVPAPVETKKDDEDTSSKKQ